MNDVSERLTAALAGRYSVERRVGGGGMADVFLARDLKHGREVALKVLRADLGAAIGRERFQREIAIAAGLHHPFILPLYDSGDADGLLFYTMPFMREETLRARLDAVGRLSVPETLRIAHQLADALDFAHSRGIIHRDVKPENVLLLADHALIADFGIARAVTQRAGEELTVDGMVLGTPTYMSPEQVFGDTLLDGRSDQYSLACIVFEMLSGGPPFSGATPQAVMIRLTQEAPPTLASRVTLVPATIESALRRALAKEPKQRFPTVKGFIDALEAEGGSAPVAGSGVRSLVVLPFANLSDEADTEFLSDGVSEELIHTLSTLEGLRVVGRTSAFALKGTTEDVRVVGQRLGVELVLEGSVRRAGQQLRITAQLTGVDDGLQRWSERFDRAVGDAFAIQDEIAAAILAALRLTILNRGAGRAAARTDDPRAHELYLRGRHSWNARTESGLHRSVDYLRGAIQADAGFGLAHAALAESYITLAAYGVEPPETVMPLAEAAARSALQSDPRLAEAHAALAGVQALYHWKWDEAEDSFRRALGSNPAAGNIRQSYSVNLLLPRARWDAAEKELERARVLEPLSPVIALSVGLIRFLQRDYDGAIRVWREVLATDENFPPTHYFLGQALALAGRPEDGLAALDRAAQLAGPTPEIVSAAGCALAAAGRPEEARAKLVELTHLAERRYVSPVLPAQVLAALHEPAAAIAELERAVAGRAVDTVWLGVRPAFDSLRGETSFQELLRRVGLG